MTPALFWTLVLAAAVLAAVLLAVRRVLASFPDTGSGSVGERLAVWRDHVAGSRPVNLESWPETLAGQALRAARPVPGGREVASSYQVRCGAGLYGTAASYTAELESAFVGVLRDCCGPRDLPEVVRIRFVYDEFLAREAYRLDVEFPYESPTDSPSGTVLYVPPAPDAAVRPASSVEAETVAETPLSWWTIVLPGGQRQRVPEEGTVVVGASAGCDVVVDDPHVSGHHLRLSVEGDRLEVRDGSLIDDGDGRTHTRQSMNGTFLRGHPVFRAGLVPGATPVTLRLGPTVELTIEYADPAATHPMLDAEIDLRPAGGRR